MTVFQLESVSTNNSVFAAVKAWHYQIISSLFCQISSQPAWAGPDYREIRELLSQEGPDESSARGGLKTSSEQAGQGSVTVSCSLVLAI